MPFSNQEKEKKNMPATTIDAVNISELLCRVPVINYILIYLNRTLIDH